MGSPAPAGDDWPPSFGRVLVAAGCWPPGMCWPPILGLLRLAAFSWPRTGLAACYQPLTIDRPPTDRPLLLTAHYLPPWPSGRLVVAAAYRLLLAGHEPLTTGRLVLAALYWPPHAGRLVLAALYWPPAEAAQYYYWPRTIGRLLLAASPTVPAYY